MTARFTASNPTRHRTPRRISGPKRPAMSSRHPQAAIERDKRLTAGIADCDRRIKKYHQLLDHDVDPALAAAWITEAQRERKGLESQLGENIPSEQLSSSQVKALVTGLRDIVAALAAADPADKADLYKELGVTLRYDTGGTVTVRARPRGVTVGVVR